MLKFVLRKLIKKAAPLLVSAFILCLQNLAKKSDNTIDDHIVIAIINNKKKIIKVLKKFGKKYIKLFKN